MEKQVFRVIDIEDNVILNPNQALNAMVLKYTNPFISFPFLKSNETNAVLTELSKKANINFDKNILTDQEGNELNHNTTIINIVNNLYENAKRAIEKSEKFGVTVAELSKKLIETKVIPHLNQSKEEITNMSVEDLMEKLYQTNENGGKVK